MNSKAIGKIIRRFWGRLTLAFFSFIIKFISENFLYALANFISKIGYYIAGRHRRIALESLNIAFGKEKSQEEIKKIAKDSFKNMVRSAVEVLFLVKDPHLLKEKKIEIEGKNYLDKALLEGKGVIVVSAHFGNFPLMLTKFAQLGYKTNVIIRRMRDQKVDEYFLKKRTASGIITIYSTPRNRCITESLKVLRNNELLFIQMDQNFGTGGIFVDFFGRKAATATGPIIFALRTKAPILPIFIIRDKDNSLKIIIEAPLQIEEGINDELIEHSEENRKKNSPSAQLIQNNVQKITNIIESYIRRYPEEWGWIHRRWKSRPNN